MSAPAVVAPAAGPTPNPPPAGKKQRRQTGDVSLLAAVSTLPSLPTDAQVPGSPDSKAQGTEYDLKQAEEMRAKTPAIKEQEEVKIPGVNFNFQPHGDEPIPMSFKSSPEVVDDFIRNFLVSKGLLSSLNAFQTEWYEFQQKGKLSAEDVMHVPDAYRQIWELEESLRKLRCDLESSKDVALNARAMHDKLRRERDFHRMHHKRVVQEKARFAAEVRRLKDVSAAYEPELKQLRQKYELAIKEKMLLKLDNNKFASKLESLSKDEARPNDLVAPSTQLTAQRHTAHSIHHGKLSPEQRENPYRNADLAAANLEDMANVGTVKAHDLAISAIKFHPKKMIFATVSDDKTWKMWSFPNCELIMSGKGHRDWIGDCDFHPRGAHLATASGDNTIKIWDFSKGEVTLTLSEHRQAVWSCAFHDQGDMLATGSLDTTVKLWDIPTGKCKTTLHGHSDAVSSVTWQPYTNIVVSTSADQSISMWDCRTGLPVRNLTGHFGAVNCATFTLKGDLFATSDVTGHVKIWDARNFTQAQSFSCGPSSANRVAFDPSGTVLAVASDDRICRAIDLRSKIVEIKELLGHEDSVQGVAFDRNAEYLVSVGSDCTVRVFQ